MRTNRSKSWRNGLGLSQIMATLLVVLPTLAFMITLLIEYWSVMQADYRLKLVANIASDYSNQLQDSSTFDLNAFSDAADDLCPGASKIKEDSKTNNSKSGQISIKVDYTFNGTYFKNKTLTTSIYTYSFNDQNMSITLKCE